MLFVVNLTVKKNNPNFEKPWFSNTSKTGGSAFAIQIDNKKYIITNAHVVKYATFIVCSKPKSDLLYQLKVFDIAFAFDLALLEPISEIEEFWKDVVFPKIALPPKRGEVIRVLGFPNGGDNLSITSGIISRITSVLYNNTYNNLAIQVDSAINPGNSGGPVINEKDELIGVAFAHDKNTQNICFIIPSIFVLFYIESIKKHKKFPGVCSLDISTDTIENDTIRKYFKVTSGIIVNKINPIGSVGHLLEKHDIIHKIDDIRINNDATIYLDNYTIVNEPTIDSEKIVYTHILRMKHPGDKLKLHIFRNKKEKIIECKIQVMTDDLVPTISNSIPPKYLIIGGLIFTPLNYYHLYNEQTQLVNTNRVHLVKYLYKLPKTQNEEIIILLDILDNSLTSGYKLSNSRLISVNNIKINNILELWDIYKEIINNQKPSKFLKIEFENNKLIVLDIKLLENIQSEILKNYGIIESNIQKES